MDYPSNKKTRAAVAASMRAINKQAAAIVQTHQEATELREWLDELSARGFRGFWRRLVWIVAGVK